MCIFLSWHLWPPPPSLVLCNCFAETLEGVWGFKSQTICPLHILQWFYNEHFTYLHHSLVSEDWLYCTWACGPKLGMETVCLSGSHFHVPKWLSAPPPEPMTSLHTNSPRHPQPWPKPNTPTRLWQHTRPPWCISHANPMRYFGNKNKTHDALLPVISPSPDEARPSSIPSDSNILILLTTHWQGCLCQSVCDLSNLLKWGLLYT